MQPQERNLNADKRLAAADVSTARLEHDATATGEPVFCRPARGCSEHTARPRSACWHLNRSTVEWAGYIKSVYGSPLENAAPIMRMSVTEIARKSGCSREDASLSQKRPSKRRREVTKITCFRGCVMQIQGSKSRSPEIAVTGSLLTAPKTLSGPSVR